MPGQGRLGDQAHSAADAHGCPGCPHPTTGPAISGSPNVFVNGRPALRVDDVGLHAACCAANMWSASKGSATVFINGKAAHRIGDETRHCGGQGTLIEGSADVLVGDAGAADHAAVRNWVAFRLADAAGGAIGARRYRVTAADGRVFEGRLDQSGFARVPGVQPGECKIAFPDLGEEV